MADISIEGEGNLISPPTSAAINQIGARDGRVQSSVLSSSAAHAGQGQGDAGVVESKRKDLGVGPDVPEIQSPRKGCRTHVFVLFLDFVVTF